ncbi:MAG: hypothetical protein ABGY41_00775, partial [Candidatus Poribacteria bacterium]
MSAESYSQDILYLVRHYDTDLKTGLTTTEALARARDSANTDLVLRTERPPWRIALEQAACPKTLTLLATSGLGFAFGIEGPRVALVLLCLTFLDL